MGSDSFQNLSKWKNAAFIQKHYHVYIYNRPGFEINETLASNTTLVAAPLLQLSATAIRQTIKEGKSFRYMVPAIVEEEIEKGGYYK